MKMRTIIVIDSEHDLHGLTPNDFVQTTKDQLVNGELYVDEFMEMSNSTSIVCFPHD